MKRISHVGFALLWENHHQLLLTFALLRFILRHVEAESLVLVQALQIHFASDRGAYKALKVANGEKLNFDGRPSGSVCVRARRLYYWYSATKIARFLGTHSSDSQLFTRTTHRQLEALVCITFHKTGGRNSHDFPINRGV